MATLLPSLPLWTAVLLLTPALACTAAALSMWWMPSASSARTAGAWRLARGASLLALAVAVLSLLFSVFGGAVGGAFLRADPVGGVVALLVAFIGWVIVRYSQPYLAGEPGERGYVGWLMGTLAAVHLVVVANHLLLLALAWMATSLALHRLLNFFGERPAARHAAHKKLLLGRAADLAMLAAVLLLWQAFGTLRIDALLVAATAPPALPAAAQAAVLLVVVAALLKCAQLPFHGWLIQVMEAPTPVSALLHAGIVNLGGFVLIRLAPLVGEMPAAQLLLVLAGGFSAIVAALVMTTRISIKVALAWSTCAQMGFMLLQCGLGLWEMALLHLVAHSLYKAHAFLAAGGVVRQNGVRRLAAAAAPASVGAWMLAGLLGLLGVAAAAWAVGALFGPLFGPVFGPAFGFSGAPPALWTSAGIVALALAPLWAPLLGRRGWGALLPKALAAGFGVAVLWFVLHALLVGWVAPVAAVPQAPWWLLVALGFAALFGLQAAVSAQPGGALARRLYPWFYGGLYLDEHVSRRLFGLWPPPPGPASPVSSAAFDPVAADAAAPAGARA